MEIFHSTLMRSIFENNLDGAKKLVEENKNDSDVNIRNLVIEIVERAVEENRYEIAPTLIDLGLKLDIKNSEGRTLLHTAVMEGRIDFSRFLVESGSCVNEIDNFQRTPLLLCTKNYLKVNSQNLTELAKFLISQGAQVNAVDMQGFTPLMQASQNGNTSLCQVLVSAGADVNMKDKYSDNSALHWAAQSGHGMTCDFLVQSGALVDSMNNYDGTTSFIAAAQRNHCGVVEMLKMAGANPFHTCLDGSSALHRSACKGFEETSALLLSMSSSLESNQFLDRPDKEGKTALSRAAEFGSAAICRMLLDKGANPNSLDLQNETPLHAAARAKRKLESEIHADVCRLLIERGALTEKINSSGETPLHIAAIMGAKQCVTTLIDHGADFTAKGGPAGNMSVAGLAGKHRRKEMGQHIKALIQCKQAERAIEEIMMLEKSNKSLENRKVSKANSF